MTAKRRILLWGLLLLLPVLAAEALSALVIRGLASRGWEVRTTEEIFAEQTRLIQDLLDAGDKTRLKIHPKLGWTYRPGFQSAEHSINEQGLRAFDEYAESRPESTLRVAAFGDSFVYCEEVPTEACWTHVAEASGDDLEVLNYGVGGYGTDQAFLRFLSEGHELRPDVVLIGFAPVNLRRAPNVYRRFLADRELPLVKPRFRLRDGQLSAVDVPIPDTATFRTIVDDPRAILAYAEHDRWFAASTYNNVLYDRSATVRLVTSLGNRIWRRHIAPDRLLLRNAAFNSRSTVFALQSALLHNFADSVRHTGMQPVVVFFPDRESVVRSRSGAPTTYDALRLELEQGGVPVLDLATAFGVADPGPDGIDDWFAPGSHYSTSGNAVVGQWLAQALRRSSYVPH